MTTFEPHPYQGRGSNWIIDHPGCALMVPMGAGKTATTLDAIEKLKYDHLDVCKVLIIGPKRVIENTWPAEIQKWDNFKHLRYSIISGEARKRRAAVEADADIYLIGKENTSWLVDLMGTSWKWDMVVIDELSTFKNPSSKRFKALRTVLPFIDRVVGLTGTPTPKGLYDLWSQIYLLDRGKRLGKTQRKFQQEFFHPGYMVGYQVREWYPNKDADKRIQAAISDICMSIDQAEYATLPDCQMIDEMVDLDKDLDKYRKFKKELLLEVGDDVITADSAGVMCGKLAQYTSGTIYDQDHGVHELHTHKIDALMDLMEAANGEPVMIFYWYQHERDRLIRALQHRNYHGLDVKDPGAIDDWNAGKLDYLLLQPASAGHGLNLQDGGRIAIWYSLPNWSLELYQQANARIYRQGQKQKVMIYHLLAKGTIDLDQLRSLQDKSKVQDAMLAALKKED